MSPDAKQAIYIDENLRVILIRLDHDTLQPSFGAIYDISQPTQTPASDSRQREYPSSVFLDAQTLLCADGHGTLYVLALSSSNSESVGLLGSYELPSSLRHSSSSLAPFRLHTALSVDEQAIAVLSFKCNGFPTALSSSWKTPSAEFDIVAVRIPLDTAANNTVVRPLDILWHRRGTNVPLYLAYEKQRSVFILAGGSPYRRVEQPAVAPHEPSPNDIIPTPSADGPLPTEPTKPPPYAWTQDSEEVTVALPFPSSTSKGDINVLFSPQTLTVLVQGSDFPRYSAARLWGGISPSSSFWTWDAHGAHTYGLLTLHLEKQYAGTRWPHVFDASSGQTEVAETLDPSELYAIRESLEKYTAQLQGGAAGGGARPSLADGEADEEVDSTVGTDTCITWVCANGTDPTWAHEDWDVPFTVLSTPLPGSSSEISMVVKHTIDGLRFVLSNEDAPSGRPAWTHVSTYSALAFVLASKRDTRFTYHVPSKAVVAFEGGGGEYGGNLYLYRDTEPKNNSAKQAILRLTGNTSGSLLGVGAVHVEGQTAVLCLCEKELVVLRNVL